METGKDEQSGVEQVEETTLFRLAQAGDRDSLNRLLSKHERLVHYVTSRQQLCGLSHEEAAQAGRRGLWRAILGYQPERGIRFSTYAYKAIMHYVWAAVQAHMRACRREVSLGELRLYYYREGTDPGEMQDWEDVCQSLAELVDRLPARLRLVVMARYGIAGEVQTLKQVGERLGVCGERVRQLQEEALVWLRQPAHSQELRSLEARHTLQQYELADELAQVWLRRRGGRHGH